MAYLRIFVLFLVKILKKIKILLLDKQNDLRYLVLFPGGEKHFAFCLKQVKWSASGGSKIFLKQE